MLEANRIPTRQADRVALFESMFGPFGQGLNAYWSLRVGKPTSLAQGVVLDRAYRAGQIAPPIRDARLIIPVNAPAPRPVGKPAITGVEKVLFTQPRAVSRAATTRAATPPIARRGFPLPTVLALGGGAVALVLLLVSLRFRRPPRR